MKKIRTRAFENSELEEITLPDTLEEIDEFAFYNTPLKKNKFPKSLKKIDRCAFSQTDLEEVYIPETINELGVGVFAECENLKKVNLPLKFKDSSSRPFISCPNIEEVDFDGELTENMISMFKSSKFLKNYAKTCENQMLVRDGVLLACGSDDKDIVIPEGVTEISAACFRYADIESVTFPSTLRYIRDRAFYRTSLKELYIPANVKSIGQFAFLNTKTLTKLTIEDKQQYPQIGLGAFENCSNLKSVTLPKSLRIAAQAFDGTPYEGNFKVGQNDTTGLQLTIEPEETEIPKETQKPETTLEPDKFPVLEVTNQGGELEVIIEDEKVIFPDAKPFIDENNRTQIPVRAVAEMLGFDVDYDNGKVTLQNSERKITLCIGKEDLVVDFGYGVECSLMDTTARIVNDRTYVPIRYIGEMLGYTVEWK